MRMSGGYEESLLLTTIDNTDKFVEANIKEPFVFNNHCSTSQNSQ